MEYVHITNSKQRKHLGGPAATECRTSTEAKTSSQNLNSHGCLPVNTRSSLLRITAQVCPGDVDEKLVPWIFDYYTKLDFSPAHKIHNIHALRMVSASSALSSFFCYMGLADCTPR